MFAQIVAICIFLAMFMLIILDKFERHYVTLGSGALVLVLVFGICMHSMSAIWETLNFGAFFESSFWYGASEESTAGINWSTVVFIAGMMIMVEGLGKAAIIITSPIVRMYFKKLTEDYFKDLIVVSYNEVESDVELQSVGMVTA